MNEEDFVDNDTDQDYLEKIYEKYNMDILPKQIKTFKESLVELYIEKNLTESLLNENKKKSENFTHEITKTINSIITMVLLFLFVFRSQSERPCIARHCVSIFTTIAEEKRAGNR